MVGKHLIVNIHNIKYAKILEKIEDICQLLNYIVQEANLKVVGELKYQFQPIGATIIYLLAESHLSIHTFPESRYCTLDLYCCNDKIDMKAVLDVIYDFFYHECWISHKILDR